MERRQREAARSPPARRAAEHPAHAREAPRARDHDRLCPYGRSRRADRAMTQEKDGSAPPGPPPDPGRGSAPEVREPEYARTYAMSLAQWMLYHQDNIVFDKVHWMGVRALKNPLDCWIYQEIIWETKPEVLIEIGSLHGGSTMFFCHLFDIIGSG